MGIILIVGILGCITLMTAGIIKIAVASKNKTSKLPSVVLVAAAAAVMVGFCVFIPQAFNMRSNGKDNPASQTSGMTDEGLFSVEITLPATFFESISSDGETYTAESVIKNGLDSRIKNPIANADGSMTFTISKSDHQKMMKEMRQSIMDSASAIKESFGSVQKIEVNSDCTHIKVYVLREQYEHSMDAFALVGYELQGLMYQAYNGTADNPVLVEAIDIDTGETIESVNSADQ